MTTVTAAPSAPIPSSPVRTSAQDGRNALAPIAMAPRFPAVEAASRADGSVNLSQRALDLRVAQLGSRTVDVAQQFISNFAHALFGDQASGARFSFDSVSLTADARASAAVQHSASAGVSTDAAMLELSESAHFIGKGQIVTADGEIYSFEIEVRYEASLQAAAVRRQEEEPVAPDALVLTGRSLPEIKFPGGLADLFKLLGRQLEVGVDGGSEEGARGNLSLRLLRLVNSAALLAPRPRADDPQPTAAMSDRAIAAYSPAAPAGNVTSA